MASADHAVSEAIYLWDPDALGIEVYADRPRSSWQKSNGELYMTTEPLDLGSLVDAAAGTEWTGMQRGTVLGHMHLHVSDLTRASALYHSGLGLAKTVWSYPGALFLAADGYHHHLGLNTWAGNAPSRASDEAGLLEWEIRLPAGEANATRQQLESRGFVVDGPAESSYRVVDEWGNALRVVPDTN
jgi:catechol 2,3-dioxygenase